MLKKILFWGRIFEVKNFNGFMCFESPEFKYMLLTAGLCTSVISIIKKQIITETPKLENYMLIMWYYLKLFIKIGQIVCTGAPRKNSNTLWLMGEIS